MSCSDGATKTKCWPRNTARAASATRAQRIERLLKDERATDSFQYLTNPDAHKSRAYPPLMGRPHPAVVVSFAGAAGALLGLAWDVSIHSANPTLAAHESVVDILSPAHDLIAVGILVAAISGTWAIAATVNRWLGVAAIASVLACVGWMGETLLAAPVLPTGTPQQQAAAVDLWQRTAKATERYRYLSAARADGYLAYNPIGQLLVHYINPAYMRDGRVLDPQHVESLVYENSVRGPQLVAAMYSLEDPSAAPPDIAGALTPWH